jgi:hypothetical protein
VSVWPDRISPPACPRPAWQEVGLAAVVVLRQPRLHAQAAQVVGDAVDQEPVRLVADGVESHQAAGPGQCVGECRKTCDKKKFEARDKDDLARKQEECKQDCIRGC